MINTILNERFAMANTIKYANDEIEKAKTLAEVKGQALREKENQLNSLSSVIKNLYYGLQSFQKSNPEISTNLTFNK